MEPKLKADFVPDKVPGKSKVKLPKVPSTGGSDFLVVFAIIVFASSLAVAAGTYFYKKYYESELDSMKTQLDREKKLVKYDTIRILARLDKRMKESYKLLKKHLAPTMAFELLQDITLKSVYYKKLDYSFADDGNIKVSAIGVADSVNSIALQSELFGKNKAVIDPLFSNLKFVGDGVEFKLDTKISRDALLFSNLVQDTILSQQGQVNTNQSNP